MAKVGAGKRTHKVKYAKQAIRTANNKEKAWKGHLAGHPKDLKAKEDIKKAIK